MKVGLLDGRCGWGQTRGVGQRHVVGREEGREGGLVGGCEYR